MDEGLAKAGHVEAVLMKDVAQYFNALFLQLLNYLKWEQESDIIDPQLSTVIIIPVLLRHQLSSNKSVSDVAKLKNI